MAAFRLLKKQGPGLADWPKPSQPSGLLFCSQRSSFRPTKPWRNGEHQTKKTSLDGIKKKSYKKATMDLIFLFGSTDLALSEKPQISPISIGFPPQFPQISTQATGPFGYRPLSGPHFHNLCWEPWVTLGHIGKLWWRAASGTTKVIKGPRVQGPKASQDFGMHNDTNHQINMYFMFVLAGWFQIFVISRLNWHLPAI